MVDLVSILTPSFNQGRFIRDTIESVLAQDHPAIEHVIADGGSTDDTTDVLASYDDRISWVSERDGGQGDALNKAYARSRGSIVGWLNSDDFYLSQAVVSSVVAAFAANPAVDVVYGHSIWVDERNRVLKLNRRPRFSPARLRRFDFLSQPATFFRRRAAGEGLLVDPSFHLTLDYWLWLRFLREGRTFALLDRYLAAMRYHGDAKSVRSRDEQWREDAELRIVQAAGPRRARQMAADAALMGALKVRSTLDFHRRRLQGPDHPLRLSFPPVVVRPLYQAGLIGAAGSALLLPRYFLSSVTRGRR